VIAAAAVAVLFGMLTRQRTADPQRPDGTLL